MADIFRLVGASSPCLMPTTEMILSALKRCHQRGEMKWIVGAPGVGKTTAINHFLDQHRDDGSVCVVTASPLDSDRRGAKHIISRLATTMGYHKLARSIFELSDFIVGDEHLRLIVVDECQLLNPSGYEMLRYIHDEKHCGVVFSGNPFAVHQFKSARKRAEHAALISRLGPPIEISGLIREDVAAYCDHQNVVGARARAMLEKLVMENPSGFRDAVRAVGMAREKLPRSKPIEARHLEEAFNFLGLT